MAHRLITDGELILYGPVGFRSCWDEDGFTSQEVLQALAELDGDLVVRINSGGGFAFDGIAIYNALRAREAKVTIRIDAIAASAASVIAMAGDEIVMPAGALMMIHDAAGLTIGTAEDHEKTAGVLHKLDGELARIYARRSGKSVEDIRALMDEETWLDGPEAVEAGFATRHDEDEAGDPTAFDYRIYANAPERLVSLTDRMKWHAAAASQTGRRSAPRNRLKEGHPMPTETKGAASAAEDKTKTVTAATGGDAAKAGDAPTAGAPATPTAPEPTVAAAPTPAPAPTVTAAAAAAAPAETPAQMEARVRDEERRRAADITAACEMVGKHEKASAFISEGKTLAEVVHALHAERTPDAPIRTQHQPASSAASGASWDKAVAKVNARVAA